VQQLAQTLLSKCVSLPCQQRLSHFLCNTPVLSLRSNVCPSVPATALTIFMQHSLRSNLCPSPASNGFHILYATPLCSHSDQMCVSQCQQWLSQFYATPLCSHSDLAAERARGDALQRQLQLAGADVRELGARLAAAQLEAAAGSGAENTGVCAC
jgi:hypothetical protein